MEHATDIEPYRQPFYEQRGILFEAAFHALRASLFGMLIGGSFGMICRFVAVD